MVSDTPQNETAVKNMEVGGSATDAPAAVARLVEKATRNQRTEAVKVWHYPDKIQVDIEAENYDGLLKMAVEDSPAELSAVRPSTTDSETVTIRTDFERASGESHTSAGTDAEASR